MLGVEPTLPLIGGRSAVDYAAHGFPLAGLPGSLMALGQPASIVLAFGSLVGARTTAAPMGGYLFGGRSLARLALERV